VSTSEASPPCAVDLRQRYSVADLDALSVEEARRFLSDGSRDPQLDLPLAWELLYRLEPGLYDRLVSAERLHPALLQWLPHDLDRLVEVGAGSGRLTLDLIELASEVVAIDPAAPLREILTRKLLGADHGRRARVSDGFFDDLPLPDDWGDLVLACSAFTPHANHGGDAGLAEMERVCRPGGSVVIVWPNNVAWLRARGFRYVSFAGEVFVEFASHEEAAELIEIFYPGAAPQVRGGARRRVSFRELGVNPPRDLAFKVIAA
jgi:SAM-dependent methyltransferase